MDSLVTIHPDLLLEPDWAATRAELRLWVDAGLDPRVDRAQHAWTIEFLHEVARRVPVWTLGDAEVDLTPAGDLVDALGGELWTFEPEPWVLNRVALIAAAVKHDRLLQGMSGRVIVVDPYLTDPKVRVTARHFLRRRFEEVVLVAPSRLGLQEADLAQIVAAVGIRVPVSGWGGCSSCAGAYEELF